MFSEKYVVCYFVGNCRFQLGAYDTHIVADDRCRIHRKYDRQNAYAIVKQVTDNETGHILYECTLATFYAEGRAQCPQ